MTRRCLRRKAKQKRLSKAGWRIGGAKEFLELTDVEAELIDIKITLIRPLKTRRIRTAGVPPAGRAPSRRP